jgi:hypothetical protein
MDKTIFRQASAPVNGQVNEREFLDLRDSSGIEADPWPGGRNPNQIDPGPPIPGQNCHIVIDGIGYIFADTVDMAQESRSAIGQEATAPFFGDPQNQLDTQSSDLTMLLPIGQSDFSDGIGAQRLEADPKGYEACNNLQLTPQNTLLNGPLINTETINSVNQDSDRWWQEGYYQTIVAANTTYDYFSIGRYLLRRQSGVWNLVETLNSPITNLFGYSGHLVACAGDGQSRMYSPTTGVNVTYLPYKGFSVNGNPFICYRDGRIYSAFLPNPPAITNASTESSPAANYNSYAYAVQYAIQKPDSTWMYTRLGQLIYIDKPANQEIVLGNLPVIGYKGGRVYRRLFRSHNNDSTYMYLLADYTSLLDERVGWVDQAFSDTGLTTLYDWNTYNSTAMNILVSGADTVHNMANPDVSPIWFPETSSSPSTGDYVWQAQTFHDTSGNEGVIFGTTSGFFAWDGVSANATELRPQNYNYFNCFSLAVNHGLVYFTLARTIAKAWTATQETFINGPWYSHYTSLDDVRLISAGEYVFFAVSGYTHYTPYWTVSYYRYNGKSFDWQLSMTYPNATGNNIRPIIGALGSEHSFIWFNNNGETHQNIITLDPKYNSKQTSNVMFRSSMSDCGLPRLRKQVFAVMVRYLQFTAQPNTTMRTIATVGATAIYVNNASLFNVGDWIAIDDNSPTKQEYRKITNVDTTNNVLWLQHVMGSELQYEHAIGTGVYRCGAVVTLRNVFADGIPIQDIEVGGPYRPDYLFSYIHLPNPVYTFLDGIEIDWLPGTIMELIGWSMITGLNPPYYGKMDLALRLQDYVKLPNSMFDNATALERRTNLENAYNKGMVVVEDQFNQERKMRFQRLSFNYEEPKQRHSDTKRNQATAHVSLIDIDAELMKQESLVLGIPTNQ